jgi:hypothetical protein
MRGLRADSAVDMRGLRADSAVDMRGLRADSAVDMRGLRADSAVDIVVQYPRDASCAVCDASCAVCDASCAMPPLKMFHLTYHHPPSSSSRCTVDVPTMRMAP